MKAGVWLVVLIALNARAAEYDVRSYGAKGDGRSLDTSFLQQAIDAAGESGGTVRLSAGSYLSHSLHLRSHVTLFLDAGATVIAAPVAPDGSPGYDLPEPNPHTAYQDFGHSHWHNSLIWAENAHYIAIIGPGRIEGRGLERGEFSASAGGSLPKGAANKAIALKNCHGVKLQGFTTFHGGHFAILTTGCDGMDIRDLTIDTNRDGIDIDCCRNVRIDHCRVNSPDDDAICLKSSYALGQLIPTEDVSITHCTVTGFDEGTLLDGTRKKSPRDEPPNGRIKLGTESNGGFRRITISDCTFEYCKGLALEIVDGGTMEDISVSRLTMKDVFTAPIFIRLGGRSRGPGPPLIGTIRRVQIDDVIATNGSGLQGIFLTGLPQHLIEDVTLKNVSITYVGGGTKEHAVRKVPEREKDYPEPVKFGPTPAYGLYARHLNRLALDQVELRLAGPDARPLARFENVIQVDGELNSQGPKSSASK